MRLEGYIGEKQPNDIFHYVAVKNLTSVTPISDIYLFDTKNWWLTYRWQTDFKSKNI